MCRLVGFRSQTPAPVHAQLVLEKNSLRVQSREHKDGWGIAHYGESALPSVVHGLSPAHSDPEFERACQLLSSRAVVAHVRLASIGPVHQRNAHPFTYGPWTFAHNGTLRDFTRHQAALESEIDPAFRALIQGETDSERCFFLFLTQLAQLAPRDGPVQVDQVARALTRTTQTVSRLTDQPDTDKPSSANFLVTNGAVMVATRRNRTLYFSECRGKSGGASPPNGARLERLVIASEELSVEDTWYEVPESSVISVDGALTLRMWPMSEL